MRVRVRVRFQSGAALGQQTQAQAGTGFSALFFHWCPKSDGGPDWRHLGRELAGTYQSGPACMGGSSSLSRALASYLNTMSTYIVGDRLIVDSTLQIPKCHPCISIYGLHVRAPTTAVCGSINGGRAQRLAGHTTDIARLRNAHHAVP